MYSDIINLPHHISPDRKRMTNYERAAQFGAFKALTGYEDEIDEAARLTDSRPELSEDDINRLNDSFKRLKECIKSRPRVELRQFVPDKYKPGGMVVKVFGKLRRIDEVGGFFILEDKRKIPIRDVVDISASQNER
jgi:hypothetical protein